MEEILCKAHKNELSPYKSINEMIDSIEQYAHETTKLLLTNVSSTLGLRLGKAHANAPLIFKGRIQYNPRTGRPITVKEWKQLESAITKFLDIEKDTMQKKMVKDSFWLGSLIQRLDKLQRQKAGLKRFDLTKPNFKVVDFKTYEDNAMKVAEQLSGIYIQNVNDKARSKIQQVIVQDTKMRKPKSQVYSDLWDIEDDINRDWDRVARTETAMNANDGFLLTALSTTDEDYAFMKGLSAPNACPYCKRHVHNQVVVVLKTPPKSGGDTVKVKGKTYTAIWPGKSNFGRKAADYWAATIMHPYCYDKETKVLTSSGWKYFKDVEKTDLIMSINPQTKEVDFVPFKKKVQYKYEGKMIHFKSRSYDMMVTPNHNMLYTTQYYNDRLMQCSAEDLLQFSSFRLPRAVAVWNNFTVSKSITDCCKKWNISIETYVKLWGWFLSEGAVSISRGRWQLAIMQKEPIAVMDDLIELKPYSRVGKSAVYIFEDSIVDVFKHFHGVHSFAKYVPYEIKQLPAELLQLFLDTYLKGDGTSYTYSGKSSFSKSTQQYWYTSSNKMAADLSELIVKIGNVPSLYLSLQKGKINHFPNGDYASNHDIWHMGICKSKYKHFNRNTSTNYWPVKVDYNNTVYDVELEKWHHLLVSRNGKVAWSGNCRCSWTEWDPELEKYFKE